jgi:hypothetical protein
MSLLRLNYTNLGNAPIPLQYQSQVACVERASQTISAHSSLNLPKR